MTGYSFAIVTDYLNENFIIFRRKLQKLLIFGVEITLFGGF